MVSDQDIRDSANFGLLPEDAYKRDPTPEIFVINVVAGGEIETTTVGVNKQSLEKYLITDQETTLLSSSVDSLNLSSRSFLENAGSGIPSPQKSVEDFITDWKLSSDLDPSEPIKSDLEVDDDGIHRLTGISSNVVEIFNDDLTRSIKSDSSSYRGKEHSLKTNNYDNDDKNLTPLQWKEDLIENWKTSQVEQDTDDEDFWLRVQVQVLLRHWVTDIVIIVV